MFLALATSLACGCRSMSERTYVTKSSSMEEAMQNKEDARSAAFANLVGQLTAYLVTGCPGRK